MPDDRIQAIRSIHPVSPTTWHRLKKAPAKQRIRLLDGVLDAVLPEFAYRYGNRGKQTDSPHDDTAEHPIRHIEAKQHRRHK